MLIKVILWVWTYKFQIIKLALSWLASKKAVILPGGHPGEAWLPQVYWVSLFIWICINEDVNEIASKWLRFYKQMYSHLRINKISHWYRYFWIEIMISLPNLLFAGVISLPLIVHACVAFFHWLIPFLHFHKFWNQRQISKCMGHHLWLEWSLWFCMVSGPSWDWPLRK